MKSQKHRSIFLLFAVMAVSPVAAKRPVQLEVDNQCLAAAALLPTALDLGTCQVADFRNLWQAPDRGYFGAFVDGSGRCLATVGNGVVRAECDETFGQTWRHRSDSVLTNQLGQCLRETAGALALGACEDATRWVETAWNDWSETGLSFGSASQPRVHATPDPGVIFLTDSGSLKRSLDGGVTWNSAAPFLVSSFAVDPEDADHLWAVETKPLLQGTLWQSINGGLSWEIVRPANGFPRVVVGDEDSQLVLIQGDGKLERSRDGGATFVPLNVPWVPGSGMEIKYVGGTLFAVARENCPGIGGCIGQDGFFKSLDDGSTWQTLNLPPLGGRNSRPSVAVDPADLNRFFATNNFGDRSSFRSSDGGLTWQANSEIPSLSWEFAFVPGRPGRLIAVGLQSHFSDDGGDTWRDGNFGFLNPSSPPAFLPNGEIIQAGLDDPRSGGLRLGRSRDFGSRWEPVEAFGKVRGALDRLTVGAGSRIFGYQQQTTSFRRLVKSRDGGATWATVTGPGRYPTALLADPAVVDLVFLGANSSSGFPDLIYRSRDGGATWQSVFSATSSEQEMVTALAAATIGPQTFLFAAVKEGSSGYLLRSADQGTTWQRIAAPAFVEIVFDGATGSLFASDAESFVYGSEDLGLNWSSISGMRGPVAAGGGRLWGRGVSENLVVSLDRGITKQPAALPADEAPLALRSSSQWPYPVFALLPSGKTYSSHNDGLSWLDLTLRNPAPPSDALAKALELDPVDPRVVFRSGARGLMQGRFDGQGVALGHPERRFLVEVDWQDFQGQRGRGFASTLTEETGHFWFFSGNNVELVVKILDGRHINDQYWVFFASMTNVEFNLKITDLETGAVKRYHNPLGTFASQGDTAAFPALDARQIAAEEPASAPTGLAAGNPSIILNNRFEVTINWKDFAGQQGQGLGQKLTPDSGSFYFFSESNVEAFVKVLDGRHINGHFWVFVAGLSNVEFTVSVRDLSTSSTRFYGNPSGQFASISDTSAF